MFAILALFPIERTHEEVKCVEQTFGSFLREKRMARGLTLRGMAAKLDLSPVYMSNIENDRRAAPSQEYLERMALLLQWTSQNGNGCLTLRQNLSKIGYPQTFRTTSWIERSSGLHCAQPGRQTPPTRSGRILSTESTGA